MEKLKHWLSRVNVIGWVLGIITLIWYISGFFGANALDAKALSEATEFNEEQAKINMVNSSMFTSINTKLDLMMDYFKISPK
jgi:hypothetical protein